MTRGGEYVEVPRGAKGIEGKPPLVGLDPGEDQDEKKSSVRLLDGTFSIR